MKKVFKPACILTAALLSVAVLPLTACSKTSDEVVLRVSNWAEYIDEGRWDSEELIDIDNPYDENAGGVIGVNPMVDDFTDWFNSQNYGFNVRVEYSTFGTNEDLYNRLNLGDTYDLVCPSDYMLMQLIREDKVEKFSDKFFDKSIETNYYVNNVSPYISGIFSDYGWDKYAACYMFGTTGMVYNPERVATEDVSSWDILTNTAYNRKETVKDNVRDAYFAALGILNKQTLLSDSMTKDERSRLLNSTDDETIAAALDILKDIKNNVYSFETDSGKADMVTGKVISNYQWSGDAVLIMDQSDADTDNPTELWYSVPYECTNLWFDGWLMLKDGVNGDEKKHIAAEAFVNFLSRPDNAIRNMYYIGYTSAIAGDTTAANNMILDYLSKNYGFDKSNVQKNILCYVKENVNKAQPYYYDVSYFFGKPCSIATDIATFDIDGDGTISRGRQLFAQYPPQNVIARSVVMLDFGDRLGAINQMWINVRCLDVKDFNPAVVWTLFAVAVAGAVAIILYKLRYKIFYRDKKQPD